VSARPVVHACSTSTQYKHTVQAYITSCITSIQYYCMLVFSIQYKQTVQAYSTYCDHVACPYLCCVPVPQVAEHSPHAPNTSRYCWHAATPQGRRLARGALSPAALQAADGALPDGPWPPKAAAVCSSGHGVQEAHRPGYLQAARRAQYSMH